MLEDPGLPEKQRWAKKREAEKNSSYRGYKEVHQEVPNSERERDKATDEKRIGWREKGESLCRRGAQRDKTQIAEPAYPG